MAYLVSLGSFVDVVANRLFWLELELELDCLRSSGNSHNNELCTHEQRVWSNGPERGWTCSRDCKVVVRETKLQAATSWRGCPGTIQAVIYCCLSWVIESESRDWWISIQPYYRYIIQIPRDWAFPWGFVSIILNTSSSERGWVQITPRTGITLITRVTRR